MAVNSEYIKAELLKVNWGVLGFTIIMTIIGLLVMELGSPVIRPFYINEATLWYPFMENTVPLWSLALYGILMIICLCIVEIIFSMNYKFERYWVALRLVLSFAVCIGLTFSVSEISKNMTGELRPDFGHRCFDSDFPPTQFTNDVVLSDSECQDTGLDLSEGRKSFVSGHASISFAIGIFCVLYLLERAKEAAKRRMMIISQVMYIVLFFPIFFAVWVCITRVTDNKHEVQDVVGGACLGSLMAVIAYLYEFPRTYHLYYRQNNNLQYDTI